MAEYITRNNAISAVCFGCNIEFSEEPCEPENCKIRQAIMALPLADVSEVRHAYWKTVTEKRDSTVCGDGVQMQYKICSNCENPMGLTGADYCGWCGARMDGTQQKEG